MKELKYQKSTNLIIYLLVVNCFLANIGLYDHRSSIEICVSIILMAPLIISHNKEKYDFSFNSVIKLGVIVCLIIIGVMYAVSGIRFKVPTYCALFLLFTGCFVLYLLKRIELEQITDSCTKALVFCSFAVSMASIILVPLTASQYEGILDNPNRLGEMIAAAVVAHIYQYEKTHNTKYKVFILISFGMEISLMLYSRSRTALLAICCIALIYLIYNIRNKYKTGKKILVFVTSIIVMLAITFIMVDNVARVISNYYDIKSTVSTIEQEDIQKTEELEVADVIESSLDRYQKGINDGSSFTSGRIEIWKEYFKNIEIVGHAPEKLSIAYNNQIIKANAHNSFLQISYQAGGVAGIAYLVITILGFIWSLYMFIKKKDKNVLLCALIILNGIIFCLLSNVITPTTSFSLILMWFIVLPNMIKPKVNCIE